MPPLIFRKGLDLKHEVAGVLADSYRSDLIDAIKTSGLRYTSGRLTIHLAREFGFCYGVDRAVDYAYQARRRFPDRSVYLTGEIIHNPHVNDELRAQGIRFLSDGDASLAWTTARLALITCPSLYLKPRRLAHLTRTFARAFGFLRRSPDVA